jgi:hypothetical protein
MNMASASPTICAFPLIRRIQSRKWKDAPVRVNRR